MHAWVNVNLVSSAVDLPIAREHLVYRHPEWLMVPRDIAQDVARSPVGQPGLRRQARALDARAAGELEGLYASPIVPAAADYLQSVVRDLARRYALDGVHLDYARYPERAVRLQPRSRSPSSGARCGRGSTAALRRQLDAREKVDLFAYPDALPGRMARRSASRG